MSHIINFECGGGSGLAGAMYRTLKTDSRGMLSLKELKNSIHKDVPLESWKYARVAKQN